MNLFEGPHIERLRRAREAGEDGMVLAAERADREAPSWQQSAYTAACAAAAAMPACFTFEQLRERCTVAAPPDLRAWGAVCHRMVRERDIVATGGYAPRLSGHGTPTRLYQFAHHGH
jgi:hypothetical protein